MERDIKPTYDELESYVENLQKQLADAQATIAALQAERDTARRRVDELEAREVDVVLLREDLEKCTVELEAVNHTASTHQALWREACDQRDKAQAELERVRGERDKLQSEVDGWELGSRVFP